MGFLKDNNHEKSIDKLKEHEIDAEIFWSIDEGKMSELLDITKVYGEKKTFFEKIEKIKKEWNEKKEKELKESKKINKDGIRDLLSKLATSDVNKTTTYDLYQK